MEYCKNAVEQIVEYGLDHRETGDVIYFGIDEISRKKGQVYLTNVYDLKEIVLSITLW